VPQGWERKERKRSAVGAFHASQQAPTMASEPPSRRQVSLAAGDSLGRSYSYDRPGGAGALPVRNGAAIGPSELTGDPPPR